VIGADRALGEPTLGDTRRVQVARARRRLLYGDWEADAIRRIRARLGAIRREAVGYPDLSANPFRSVCHQTAVLYDRAPRLSHPDDTDGSLANWLTVKLSESLWASKMQRIQRDTIGIREMLVRPDITSRGRLTIRPVFPDRCEIEPHDEEPDRPGTLREARIRKVAGVRQWTYDEIDPEKEQYRVVDAQGEVITAKALGSGASGERYPYRWDGGRGDPYLAAVLYHATPTGELWDWSELRELYEATLESCVLWTFWGHCVRDASWPQRWAIDLEVKAATTEGPPGTARQGIVTDPTVLLRLTRSNPDAGASPTPPGQFAPGADPLALAEALMIFESRIAAYVGVTDPDFIRTSGDPRSGYALAISRDGQRAAARKFEPQFRAGDEELLGMCAALLNTHLHDPEGGFDDERAVELPESGWSVRYLGLPLTPEEQDARRRDQLELLDKGLTSRERAYSVIHDLSLEEARRELEEMDRGATRASA